jgi:hypothetical protein
VTLTQGKGTVLSSEHTKARDWLRGIQIAPLVGGRQNLQLRIGVDLCHS